MAERFRIYTDGPGPAFKIEVSKIWIENGEMLFNIVDWNRTIGLPKEIFEHVKEDTYRFITKNVHAWISREPEKKTEVSVLKPKEEDQEAYYENINLEDLGKEVRTTLLEMKEKINYHIEVDKDKFNQAPLRAFIFFTSRFKEEIEKIKIPEEINRFSLRVLSSKLTKFLTTLKFLNSKPLPGFSEVQPALLDLNFLAQKLEKQHKILLKKI